MIAISESTYLFDVVPKDPATQRDIELVLYDLCAAKWASNEDFASNEFALPRTPTGFAYEATTAGRSGVREPRWPTTIGGTVQDGSVTWTCRAAATNAINAATLNSAVSDPTGITVSNTSIADSFKVWATYEGGVDGQRYDAVFNLTIAGRTIVCRQPVQVGKQ